MFRVEKYTPGQRPHEGQARSIGKVWVFVGQTNNAAVAEKILRGVLVDHDCQVRIVKCNDFDRGRRA